MDESQSEVFHSDYMAVAGFIGQFKKILVGKIESSVSLGRSATFAGEFPAMTLLPTPDLLLLRLILKWV